MVGAKFNGHASLSTEVSNIISAFDASVDSLTPVSAIIVTSSLLSAGIRAIISPVSPEYEISKIIDFLCTFPRSPCIASAGCRNILGVPVEAKVEDIFLPTNPDLPIPQIIIWAELLLITFTALAKSSPSIFSNLSIPSL